MRYNVYIEHYYGHVNLWHLDKRRLDNIVKTYALGHESFTLSGKQYKVPELATLKIFTAELTHGEEYFEMVCRKKGLLKKSPLSGKYYPPECLAKLGRDVTEDFIGDKPFGWKKAETEVQAQNGEQFISESRLQELRALHHPDFDTRRLVKLCEELNANYLMGNYLAVGMLGRTILHHIPPVFECKDYKQVAANVGRGSVKESLQHLLLSKSISDSINHEQIRKKDTLPTEATIDFRQALDVLLAEIVRKLSESSG